MFAMHLAERHHRVDVYQMLHELHDDELELWAAYHDLTRTDQPEMYDPEEFAKHV